MRHKRIVVSHYGGPEELQVVDEDIPEPGRGDVRVRVLAAGVSQPDIMAREGIHPETPKVPYTPGWDLVGVVDKAGDAVTGLRPGQLVAAMPINGAYAGYICLPERECVPVPDGLDPAEAVSLILNYVTAYQMLHRSVTLRAGQRALIHGASGGVGTALLQLGGLIGLQMYGTCSARTAPVVAGLGATPIDYQNQDVVAEVRRLTGDGVDVAFDSLGGSSIWRSRETLRRGGRVVAYGLTGSLQGGRLASGGSGRRRPYRAIAVFAVYIAASYVLPGRRRVVPYSIQTLKRLKPKSFREDLTTLFALLKAGRIRPLVAARLPLTDARRAHEMLGKGGVAGKIVLLAEPNSPIHESPNSPTAL